MKNKPNNTYIACMAQDLHPPVAKLNLMPRSHQTFCPVLAVKLLGIMFRYRCWPTTFTLLQLEMPTDGVWTGQRDQPSMPWSHQTFRLVPTVKLIGIMSKNGCWPTTFCTITTGDANGRCQKWPRDQPLRPQSHQTLCPVQVVKLLGIMLRTRCWSTIFHTMTARDADELCPKWLVSRANHTNHFWHHLSASLSVIVWKVAGQHLFLNIIPNNFTTRTEWKGWCDRGMIGPSPECPFS